MGRHSSESPRARRERSPARHRNLNMDKLSSRNRSPKRGRSRSPALHRSPVREKPYNRTKSPEYKKSPSAISRSPVRQKQSNRTRSPKKEKSRSSPPLSPLKEKPNSRTRSLKSPEKRKSPIRDKSPSRARSMSPDSHSLSPRSKRLKRVKAERDAGKGNVKENEKNHSRKGDRHDEKDLGTDLINEKRERRSERDAVGNGSRSRHRRSSSPSHRHHRGERRSRSPFAADNRGRNERTSSRDPEQWNNGSDSMAKMKAVEETLDAKEKQKPSFELSGKLAEETNRVRGVTLLFNEPPDARKPDIRWRFYVFKGGEVLNEPLYVHRQSYYLFGRERRVADIPTDHPSCSKQHAVLQYRQVEEENPDGTMSKRVRPYMMDLGSTNGTFINENQMEPQRYYELFEKDTVKFGNSRSIISGCDANAGGVCISSQPLTVHNLEDINDVSSPDHL